MLRNRAIETEDGCGSGFLARQASPYRGKDAPLTVRLGFKVFCFLSMFCTLFLHEKIGYNKAYSVCRNP